MTTTAFSPMSELVTAFRAGLRSADPAGAVARALAVRPPVLTGIPHDVSSHLLHAETELSLVALVWRPGRVTPVHDHLCWCVVHVVQGTVTETRYRTQDVLATTSVTRQRVGATTVLRPPDDIHRIANDTADTAITLHVYGMDLRTGGSTRRRYADPAPLR
ncbi:cysteine dioxygenase [Pseudonocardia sp. CA-107938]|uniref:cysteine dioxygenase n=1 Tax=Pseudonocardia sp. CA-107938 TaxID=3240021 RepID=UPI003D916CA0